MKHSVRLFSALMLALLAVIFRSPALAQTPTLSPFATPDTEKSESYIAAASPDGTMVASIITNIVHLRVWDALSGDVLFEMQDFPPPYALDWSPDSKRIATSGGDGFIRVWCADRSKSPECTPNSLISSLPAGGVLLGIDWHKNGLLASSTQGGDATGLAIWDMNNDYRLVHSIPWYDSYQIAWNPDGNRLALATSGGLFTLSADLSPDPNIDFVTEQRLGPIVDTTSVAWSPDGNTIAAGTDQGEINLFDWETKTQSTVLMGHNSPVNALAWNPDSARLASADGNGIIRIGNIRDISFQTIRTNRAAFQISWSPDGSTLYYPLDAVEKPAGVPPDPLKIGGETQSLRSVFNAPTCKRACWLGIEPGVTTQDEVRIILSDLGIAYEAKDELGLGADPINNPYGWLPDDDLPFIDTVGGKVEVRIYFGEGMVHGIRLPVNIPVKMIREEYGAPIQVRNLNTMFELIYPQLGMNFFVSSLETDHATMLTLFSEKGALQNVEDPGSPYLLQDCALFSTPCTIATATPTTASQNPSLQNVFHSPACQSACWLGIEPGITTQAELETLLDQHQLEFTKSSIASGHLILYTVSAPSSPFLADDKPIYMDVTAEHVDLMTLFLQDVTVAQVTNEYGTPDAIISSGDRGNLLLYVDEGLIFATRDNASDVIDTVMLTSPGRDARRMSIYLENALSCNDSLDICVLATATPAP